MRRLGWLALLIAGCSSNSAEKSEAAAIDRAIDVLRDAPNDQKGRALEALRALPCNVPEICSAKSACVVGYELYVSGIEALERAKARAAAGEAGPELGAALLELQAALERARPLTERCANSQGELSRKYKL